MTPPPAAPEPGEQPPAPPASDPTGAPLYPPAPSAPPWAPAAPPAETGFAPLDPPSSAPPWSAPPASGPPAAYPPPAYPPPGYPPPGYGAGYGAPAGYGAMPPPVPAVPPGTNAFAIVSLVLSFCGGGLLGLVFGIIALVQTKRTGQKGRGLAIAGVTISSIYLLVIVIAVVAGVISGIREGNASANDGSVSVHDLSVGDCVESVSEGVTYNVTAVPCTAPHHAEVFAKFSLTGSTYPGDSSVSSQSVGGCASRLLDYSSSAAEDDDLSMFYFPPTRQSWSSDKTVVCLVVDEGSTRTSSVKD